MDKGGAVVIMNSNFYEEHIFKMLSNTDDDKEIPNNDCRKKLMVRNLSFFTF